MKFIRFLGFFCLAIPCVLSVAVAGEFQDASKLLVAARRGDVQTVQVLINSGVDVNYLSDSISMQRIFLKKGIAHGTDRRRNITPSAIKER